MICALSERYRNISAVIFEILPFLWKHRVSVVTGLRYSSFDPDPRRDHDQLMTYESSDDHG